MNRSLIMLLFLAILSSGAVYFLGQRPEADSLNKVLKPQFGGVYQRAIMDNPSTLDPAFVTDTTCSEIVSQVFSRLLRMDSNMHLIPDLAKEWHISPDKKTLTFRLKEKVRFHTITEESSLSANRGREIKSNDVQYSMQRLLDPAIKSPHASLLSAIVGAEEFSTGQSSSVTGIEILGDYTFAIHLQYPFAPFLSILTTPALSILPKEDVLKWGKDFDKHPVGSGAFIFESYAKDKTVVLRSNLDYYRGRPYLDKIHFHIMDSEATQFQEFKKGSLFHLTHIPAHRLKDAIKSKAFVFEESSSLESTYLGMNMNLPPFDRVEIRRALNHAINKKQLIRYVKNNRGKEARGPLPPEIPGYTEGPEPYPYDLNKAREYLKQAGYQIDQKNQVINFPTLTLQTGYSGDTRAVAGAIQAHLADLGIRLHIKTVSLSEHYASIDEGIVPFFSLGWVADYPDADNILYYNFHSKVIGKSNSCYYQNHTVDDLLEKARATEEQKKRNLIYAEAEKQIVADAPWLFLYYPTTYVLMQNFVHGLKICSFGGSEVDYYQVWLSSPSKTL